MPTGCSCRTFHEVKKAPAFLYRGFRSVADEHHERDKSLIALGRTVRDDKHAEV
jgi:hypothetical protein